MPTDSQVNRRLRVATLVATHWHNVIGALLEAGEPIPTDYAFFAVTRIEAALAGEIDPNILGLDELGTKILRQITNSIPKSTKQLLV
jgi:hypothetical protein